MSASRVYFPNLNGVRFLAALVVIIHHVEMGKFWLGQPNVYANSFVGGVFGQLGIILFFVLSGFLITYLLLEEHKRSQTISVKSFYMRRILRIWPLYYLIIIFSLFIIPHFSFFDIPGYSERIYEGFALKSAFFLTFLPNVGYTFYEHIPYASQTWSVGVEEQFYLLWPLLMLWALKKKKVMQMFLGVIAVYLVIKTITVYYYIQTPQDITTEKIWLLWDHFSIDCMAIGGIGAYLLFNKKERILNILFNKYLQVAVYITIAIVTVKGLVLPWYNKEWYALLFIVVILNLAANPKSIIRLEFKPLNYLGKISYGLYMYHNFILILLLKLILKYNLLDFTLLSSSIIYHILVLGTTILVSAFSYEYFEKGFLTIKNRFVKVESGNKVSGDTGNNFGDENQEQLALNVSPQRI